MFVFGPLSSIFDFVTFGLLLWVFHADEKLFHTGWFVESLATQILVIFIIRTAHPLRDRPHPALVASYALRLRRGCGASLFAAGALARLRSAAGRPHGRARAGDHRLSCPRLCREALVLQALSAGLGRYPRPSHKANEDMIPLEDESRRPSRFPIVTATIIALNVLVFILELMRRRCICNPMVS